jgi:PKD repeat protein
LTGSVTTTLPFSIASSSTLNVSPGQTSLVQVAFRPTTAGNSSNVVVFSSNGGNSTNTVTGNAATVPVASFAASPTNGTWPLVVSFTDNSSGTITNRFWDFGDGNTTNTTATSFTHTYNSAGTNTVALTVTGPVGTNTQARTSYIVVTNPGPVTIIIQLSNNVVKLTWPVGTLQSAPQLTGPFTNITDAASPYTLPPTEATRFFRVLVR